MAKERIINTRFWSDSFIVDLNPLDRYLFLYLLTNEHTNICGIYELPLKRMSDETGIEREMLATMMKSLDGRVFYVDGWVYIRNFVKHQRDNDSVKKGIRNALSQIPENIIERICIVSGDSIENEKVGLKFPGISKSTKERIIRRDKVCQKCGLTEELEVDHIIPRFMGGDNSDENLRVLCKTHNLSRNMTEYDTSSMDGSLRQTPTDRHILKPKLKLKLKDREQGSQPLPKKEWKYEDVLEEMQKSEKGLDRLLSYFWYTKGFKFENSKQLSARYGRDCKTGKKIVESGYSKEQIKKGVEYVNKKYSDVDWTLETVLKTIAEANK